MVLPPGCSPKKLVAGIRRIAASYPMPRSTELQFRPPRRRQSGNSLPGKNESDGHRAFDAPALKLRTAEGAEAPYSRTPAVREYGAGLPTHFWGLHPLSLWGDNPQNWGLVIICLIANWHEMPKAGRMGLPMVKKTWPATLCAACVHGCRVLLFLPMAGRFSMRGLPASPWRQQAAETVD